jgi:membrane protease YdiL (CAAX protease family)
MMRHERQAIPFIWLGIAFEAGLGLLAWLVGWLLNEPSWHHVHWDALDAAMGLAACVPMLLVFWACVRVPVRPLVRIKTIAEQFIRPLFAGCTWLELAVLSLVAGIAEELLFRGVLQGVMSRWWGAWLGVMLAGLLFGLLHAITTTYVFLAALLGIYLGVLWLATDNLLTVIVAHALYDFVALIFLMRSGPAPGGGDAAPGGANVAEK